LLLHIVDVAPFDDSDPAEAAIKLVEELEKYNPELAERERWLLLNKLDLLPEEEREARCADILAKLGWQGPVFEISAISATGTDAVVQQIMRHIELQAEAEAEKQAAEASQGATGDDA
jgi:GTP-binding protein